MNLLVLLLLSLLDSCVFGVLTTEINSPHFIFIHGAAKTSVMRVGDASPASTALREAPTTFKIAANNAAPLLSSVRLKFRMTSAVPGCRPAFQSQLPLQWLHLDVRVVRPSCLLLVSGGVSSLGHSMGQGSIFSFQHSDRKSSKLCVLWSRIRAPSMEVSSRARQLTNKNRPSTRVL
ncbi:hypothetical protein ABL78_7561 [Leptomonas seymouri]|uniref:Secreted protein n=1 Tax=Leptomonas seymouri TaxID=5684 RepID=A0A0N1HS79_LEPSE|nr:hypothetical protein ABL78_7561 [Leptomonas seymouri]|eukprot:KPI83410.1 hypothetical protein ABL78_7561 [Leptomonas seymouri]